MTRRCAGQGATSRTVVRYTTVPKDHGQGSFKGDQRKLDRKDKSLRDSRTREKD